MDSKRLLGYRGDVKTLDMYLNEKVQTAIKSGIAKIRGTENREDAMQEAYCSIANECPIDIDDAVSCVSNAIERYRGRLRRESRKEAEGWISNSARYGKSPRMYEIIEDDYSEESYP